jgi:outer membrane protein assembly factor BamE (lipoprotein component of BamABCDE complex)
MKTTPSRVAQFLPSLALAAALAGGTPGCIVVPTPEYNTGNARDNIRRTTPNQFEPGTTTRAEVMLALGEPDAVSPDESRLAYRSEKVCGLWFVGAYGSGAGGTLTKDRYLVLSFDAQGVLREVERTSTWFGSGSASQLLLGPPAGVSLASADVATDADRPVMALRAGWLMGVDGYRNPDTATWTGQPGRMLLGGTHLLFLADAEFANSGPTLTVPYDAMAEARVERNLWSRRLVVHTRAGEAHSFEIYGPAGTKQDRQALARAADFLQARVKR